MKLEVGMFIRTDDGTIAKIEGFDGYYIFIDKPYKYNYRIEKDDFTNSSFNLIDLIEVGDVLTINQFNNDYEKVEVYETFNIYTKEKELCVLANGKPKRVIEVNIKSILTHEQYEANAYKVVE